MGKAIGGNIIFRSGRYSARTPIGGGKRHLSPMPWATDETKDASAARERAKLLAELATDIRATKDEPTIAILASILDKAAAATTDEELARVRTIVSSVATGQLRPKGSPAPLEGGETFKELAQRWTKGELHKRWPDHVKAKETSDTDEQRMGKHVYPVIGSVPIRLFTIKDAERVLEKLPAYLSQTSRRHVAQLVGHVLALAVYPVKLIEASPIPRGWLPAKGAPKAKGALYPADDAALLRHVALPMVERLLFGFLSREGCRTSEAVEMTWSDLDLRVGAIRLDENKTDDPRAWALSADVVRALSWWKERAPKTPKGLVFVYEDGRPVNVDRLAEKLRAGLLAAGVDRPELFERSEKRMRLRAHDTRSTFITISLANGKTEAWVMDRTGHTTSQMLATYRRLARHFSELNLGPLQPMDQLLGIAPPAGSRAGSSRRQLRRGARKPGKLRMFRRGTLGLGSSAARHAGSTPVSCTRGKHFVDEASIPMTDEERDQASAKKGGRR